MKIGVPKEIKPQEARVGVTPAGALSLIRSGHKVHIQKNAGLLSGFSDEDYQDWMEYSKLSDRLRSVKSNLLKTIFLLAPLP